MIKLDIGSGQPHNGDGWIGVDPYTNANVKAFMWDLPYEDGEVDEIFSSHSLEHIGKFEVNKTLAEWYRVLKSGGKVTIWVPDLEWCVLHWLRHKNSRGWELDIIFGNQNHSGEYHKTGFTQQTLKYVCERVGFKTVKQEKISTHSQQTLSIELTKE